MSLYMDLANTSVKYNFNCRCCYFQTPSVVHCMNATASAQSPKFFTKFFPANNFCQLLRVTRKRSCTSAGNAQAQFSCTFGMIDRGRLELVTSPIESVEMLVSFRKVCLHHPIWSFFKAKIYSNSLHIV